MSFHHLLKDFPHLAGHLRGCSLSLILSFVENFHSHSNYRILLGIGGKTIRIQGIKPCRMIMEFFDNRRGYCPIDGSIRGLVSGGSIAIAASTTTACDIRRLEDTCLQECQNSFMILRMRIECREGITWISTKPI